LKQYFAPRQLIRSNSFRQLIASNSEKVNSATTRPLLI
jgi:hypothetical protein